jgi:hypothetical protein
MTINLGFGGIRLGGGHTGSAPAPFNALNGPRLAGDENSHPLHSVQPEELLNPSDGPINAQFTLDQAPMVGEGITGTLQLTATGPFKSRKAYLRLVGLRLDEVKRSEEHRNSKGEVQWTERWVETSGNLFAHDSFLEPPVPTSMELGQTWQAKFMLPAPRLGPPTAHLGESIIAWALEVRWDVPMGSDHFAACYLPLAQHPDLLRAGVGKQGGQSLLDSVDNNGGTIGIHSPLPAPAGSEIVTKITWPSAPDGQGARVELHRRTNAPNGVEGILATVAVTPADLRSGAAEVRLMIPPGSAPSFDGAGLEIKYVIRALVDRKFRSDAAIERPVAIF